MYITITVLYIYISNIYSIAAISLQDIVDMSLIILLLCIQYLSIVYKILAFTL